MYQSAFTYGLTRPYPYRWFTWLVVIGGIAATALFSVINVAAGGYEMISVYVTDLNQTEHPDVPAWYQKKPWSLVSKARISCQDQVFELGSRFATNNTLLQYEIIGITAAKQNGSISRTSFTYHNDTLQDCVLQNLLMSRRLSDDTFHKLRLDVNCTVYEYNDPTPTQLTIRYEYQSDDNYVIDGYSRSFYIPGDSFLDSIVGQLDRHTQSAFWWGALFLNQAAQGMFMYNVAMDIMLDMPYSAILLEHSVKDDQLTVGTYTVVSNNGMSLPGTFQGTASQDPVTIWSSTFGDAILDFDKCNNEVMHPEACSDEGAYKDERMPTLLWDALAKVFYSFVLTDLGQSIPSNMFADGSRFVDFLVATNRSQLFNQSCQCQVMPAYGQLLQDQFGPDKANPYFNSTWPDYPNYPFGETDKSFYDWYNTSTPQVSPAVINTRYLCQVPKRRPIGSIIVSVIVADLVFIQALWKILSWLVKFFTDRKDPTSNYCLGCLERVVEEGQHADKSSDASSEALRRQSSDRVSLPSSVVIRRRPVGSMPATAPKRGDVTVTVVAEP